MKRQSRSNGTVTIRDIAGKAGFSPSTVSIVLNNAPLARYIPAETKERIHKVARQLGYRPNQLARSLRSQRNHTIGLIVFNITDPFCTPILHGIETALYQASYISLLADAHNDRSRFERYLEMLLERRVEGLIVVANWLVVQIDLLADLENRSIPTAVIGRKLSLGAVSSVMVDNEAGARMAVEHLYSLGHREIAFLRGPKVLVDTGQRWRGIRSFAQSTGLALDPKLILDLPKSFDPNEGFDAGFRLTEELLRRKLHFTALVAFDDVTALGAMRALTVAGVKVPQQCSVIGFDDVAPAALSFPPLTTIRQPMETMGACAVGLVADAIAESQTLPLHRKLAPELVVRQSTTKPATESQ
ncbi:MAG: LacI family DNA-binding transcriptional regulator [Terriglobales bacterium]|jgi:LacI family transcriptional regulator